jgi:hypothetical protein
MKETICISVVSKSIRFFKEDEISTKALKGPKNSGRYLTGVDQRSIVLRFTVPAHRTTNEHPAQKASQW